MRGQHNFVLNVGFGQSPTSIFESEIRKSDSKFGSWYQLPLLAYSMKVVKAVIEILARRAGNAIKITASLKQNLKTDGYELRYDFQMLTSLWS